MSRVRTRVASNDWWASRNVVSVSKRGTWSRTHFENPFGAHPLEDLARAFRGGSPVGRVSGASGSARLADSLGLVTASRPESR